jgi:L-ascorbate metabolism protein UlaG (beta-lactamase superfamily)
MERRPLTITWLGHASVLVDLDGVRLICDPVLRSRVGPLVRMAPPVASETTRDLDMVLLSHLHLDHTDLPTLRRLERRGPLIAPRGAGAWLRARGLSEVQELAPGQHLTRNGLRIQATRAAHDRRRLPLGPACDPVGYLVSGSRSVYFAGDTDLFPEMAQLRGEVDVALLPVWGWGPSVGPGHLDPERAARAAALIAPSVAIPIHWGTFRPAWSSGSAAERERPARRFTQLLGQYAPGVRGRIMDVGERLELSM